MLGKEIVASALQEVINKSVIISDILSTIAVYLTFDSVLPISISLLSNKINEHDPARGSNTEAYYYNIFNRLVVSNNNLQLNLKAIIHELAHKALKEVFQNDNNPYNDIYSRTKYHNAIKKTLHNIKQIIEQDFDLSITFENQEDTWQIGQTLSNLYFSQSHTNVKKAYAIANFLIIYQGNYEKYQEDEEFIVALPTIIADELYEDEIVDAVKPLFEYWEEIITPAIVEYQNKFCTTSFCAVPLYYYDSL